MAPTDTQPVARAAPGRIAAIRVVAAWIILPLFCGSWWGMLPWLALVPVFVLRIRYEEEVLVRELPGYDEYRTRVRYKLLPFVW